MTLLIKQTKRWVMGTSLWVTDDKFRNGANRRSLSNQLWSQEHGKATQQFHRTSGEVEPFTIQRMIDITARLDPQEHHEPIMLDLASLAAKRYAEQFKIEFSNDVLGSNVITKIIKGDIARRLVVAYASEDFPT